MYSTQSLGKSECFLFIYYSLVYRDSRSLSQAGEWLGSTADVAQDLSTRKLSKETLIRFIQGKAKVEIPYKEES